MTLTHKLCILICQCWKRRNLRIFKREKFAWNLVVSWAGCRRRCASNFTIAYLLTRWLPTEFSHASTKSANLGPPHDENFQKNTLIFKREVYAVIHSGSSTLFEWSILEVNSLGLIKFLRNSSKDIIQRFTLWNFRSMWDLTNLPILTNVKSFAISFDNHCKFVIA